MDPQPAQTNTSNIEALSKESKSKTPVAALLIILIILALGVGWFLYTKNQTSKSPEEKIVTGLPRDSITIGQTVAPSGVFPNSVAEDADVAFNANIFDGLGKITDGKVEPALAVSWSNPDKNTWRFNLRKGVTFQNGDPFTAADVKFSIEEALNSIKDDVNGVDVLKNDWPDVANLGSVKAVKVTDDYTVDVETVSPDPVLFNRLVFVPIVSKKQFGENTGKFTAVGTGAYKLVSITGTSAVLEANADYYLGAPRVKKVVYKFFPENTPDSKLIAALNKGETDLLRVSDEKLLAKLDSGFQVKTLVDPSIAFIWMDTARDKSPFVNKTPNPLKNKLVRRAIYDAIDINKATKEASISAEPASQLVPNSIFGFNPEIKRPQPNIEEAKNLLMQAGDKSFSLTLDVPALQTDVAKKIAVQLDRIGIKIKVNPLVKQGGLNKLFTGDTSAFILNYSAGTYDAGEIFTDVLHTRTGSFGGSNITNFSDPEIDKITDEIAVTFDPKSRAEKLQEAMTKAMDSLPLVPLYSYKFSYIIRNNFDWTPTAFGVVYPDEISGRDVIGQ